MFFYESPSGGRVFFDELGPPWPKHECTGHFAERADPSPQRRQSTSAMIGRPVRNHALVYSFGVFTYDAQRSGPVRDIVDYRQRPGRCGYVTTVAGGPRVELWTDKRLDRSPEPYRVLECIAGPALGPDGASIWVMRDYRGLAPGHAGLTTTCSRCHRALIVRDAAGKLTVCSNCGVDRTS